MFYFEGCWDSPNEKCRQHEEKWFDGCFEKQCLVKKKKNNAILKKIVLVSGGGYIATFTIA